MLSQLRAICQPHEVLFVGRIPGQDNLLAISFSDRIAPALPRNMAVQKTQVSSLAVPIQQIQAALNPDALPAGAVEAQANRSTARKNRRSKTRRCKAAEDVQPVTPATQSLSSRTVTAKASKELFPPIRLGLAGLVMSITSILLCGLDGSTHSTR